MTHSATQDRQEFQAEDDVRTLINAEKIKRDKPRLKRALVKAKEQREALAAVTSETKES